MYDPGPRTLIKRRCPNISFDESSDHTKRRIIKHGSNSCTIPEAIGVLSSRLLQKGKHERIIQKPAGKRDWSLLSFTVEELGEKLAGVRLARLLNSGAFFVPACLSFRLPFIVIAPSIISFHQFSFVLFTKSRNVH